MQWIFSERRVFGMFVLLGLCAHCGCTPTERMETVVAPEASSAEHDGDDDHSEGEAPSPAETMEKLTELNSQIIQAFEAGTPDDAHDALHEVAHLLEDLPETLAKNKEFPAESMTVVNAAVERLFNGYTELDETLHGSEEEIDLAKIKQEIDSALTELKGAVQ